MFKNLLLLNPWIYDFAAFDLWSKPIGLLYIASFLRSNNFNISYIDCLDKYASTRLPKVKKYGQGDFYRVEVESPAIIKDIPRKFARYGMSEEKFLQKLQSIPKPDAVLITSFMTYWYQGPKRLVEIIRKQYPGTPVILGGIYATLMPEHAKKIVKPDFIVSGPGEIKVLKLLCELFRLSFDEMKVPVSIDEFPYPAFDLINRPDYLVILSSRGCPFECSFCAQKKISMDFIQRTPENVVEEIIYHYKKFKLRDFAFYDDALFINPDKHIKIILEGIIKSKLPLRFHTPNGLFPGFIDKDLAELMHRSNFKTIRLSFETLNEARYKQMSNKISLKGMKNAVDYLVKAGYQKKELEAYIIMGLPDQDLEEILASMIFINNLGIMIRLASFSPIPGTEDYRYSVARGLIPADIDPLLMNNSIFPLKNTEIDYPTYRNIRHLSNILNNIARYNIAPFSDPGFSSSLISALRRIP
jgi:radical SAM superfamily enzyme YgiQ (UPF0313 family)